MSNRRCEQDDIEWEHLQSALKGAKKIPMVRLFDLHNRHNNQN